jgi:hypothetical protein
LFAGACGGNPLISHQALAKIIGSQNSIGMARSLVRRGNGLNGIDGPHSGTARPSAVAPLRRPEAGTRQSSGGIMFCPWSRDLNLRSTGTRAGRSQA